MTLRIVLQPAFVLHSRPYRDSSLLVDLLTISHGKVHALARSARGAKSRFRGLLRPFVPLLATWSGKTELMNLSTVEGNGLPYELSGEKLLSGIYLNELLVRLLHLFDPHPQLFMAYQQTLVALQQTQEHEYILRIFEKQLLKEMGYGIQFDKDIVGEALEPEQHYVFDPKHGFSCSNNLVQNKAIFLGKHIIALHNETMQSKEEFKAAKYLMRIAIESLLGDKPPKSRELFIGIRN